MDTLEQLVIEVMKILASAGIVSIPMLIVAAVVIAAIIIFAPKALEALAKIKPQPPPNATGRLSDGSQKEDENLPPAQPTTGPAGGYEDGSGGSG